MNENDSRRAAQFVAHLEPIQRQLAGYCRRALSPPDEVADTLQSAVANAFRDFDKYAEGTNFRAWMYRYVTLEILNRNRSTQRHLTETVEPERISEALAETFPFDGYRLSRLLEDPEAVLDHCDSLVATCVRELTEQERKIFLLRAMGDFKYREIAEIMDIPMGTVMSLLSRARIALREQLLEYARHNGLLSKGDRA